MEKLSPSSSSTRCEQDEPKLSSAAKKSHWSGEVRGRREEGQEIPNCSSPVTSHWWPVCSGKRREIRWAGNLTVLLLPQVTGDQEWVENGEKMGRGSLTVLLLPQVTGDQEWEEGREKMGGGPNCSFLPQVTGDQESEEEREKINRGSLTGLFLPQVTGGDQEWEEGREKMGRES